MMLARSIRGRVLADLKLGTTLNIGGGAVFKSDL